MMDEEVRSQYPRQSRAANSIQLDEIPTLLYLSCFAIKSKRLKYNKNTLLHKNKTSLLSTIHYLHNTIQSLCDTFTKP